MLAERFGHKHGGTYVEIGALDGETFSNSYYFEHCLGWSGVLVEANPTQAELCRRNRPGSRVIAKAVVAPEDAGKSMAFEVVEGFEALSSLALMPRYTRLISELNERDGLSLRVSTVDVETATLDDVLASAVATDIDFMTIDIEGHEWAALRGLSLGTRWRPTVVLIESSDLWPDHRVVGQMFHAGYAYKRSVGINDWYEAGGRAARSAGVAHLYAKIALTRIRRRAGATSVGRALRRRLGRL